MNYIPRNKELKSHIEDTPKAGTFDGPAKSFLRQKEKEEAKALKQIYNSNQRFEYYSLEQRN